jgi:thioredoxin 1
MYKSYSELGAPAEQNVDHYSVVELADPNHKARVLADNVVVCINIHADWCGPCKMSAPTYAVMASTYNRPGVALVKYNYDKIPPPDKVNIGGIPVYQLYVRGRQVDEVVGADLALVEEKLKALVSGNVRDDGGGGGGPMANRSSIRNYRNPREEQQGGVPYQENRGQYHQPYGGQPNQLQQF